MSLNIKHEPEYQVKEEMKSVQFNQTMFNCSTPERILLRPKHTLSPIKFEFKDEHTHFNCSTPERNLLISLSLSPLKKRNNKSELTVPKITLNSSNLREKSFKQVSFKRKLSFNGDFEEPAAPPNSPISPIVTSVCNNDSLVVDLNQINLSMASSLDGPIYNPHEDELESSAESLIAANQENNNYNYEEVDVSTVSSYVYIDKQANELVNDDTSLSELSEINNDESSFDFMFDNEYEVENILNHRVMNGHIQYYIKWKYWSHEHNSWVNEEDCFCMELIDEYMRVYNAYMNNLLLHTVEFN